MACVKSVKILEENYLAALHFHNLIEFHSYVRSTLRVILYVYPFRWKTKLKSYEAKNVDVVVVTSVVGLKYRSL